jgi:N-methylhydantoinase B/oxoprolinase/acetone carboxylase alpha subunit
VLKINGEGRDPKKQYVLKRCETVYMATPGGGGHGTPASRDRAILEKDIKEAYVTRVSDYEPGTIDTGKNRKLR